MNESSIELILEKIGKIEKSLDHVVVAFGERFDSIEARLDSMEARLDSLEKNVAFNTKSILEIQSKLEEIDERTQYLPKLYDHVDKFMSEIVENRGERVFMVKQLKDYEKRILALEH